MPPVTVPTQWLAQLQRLQDLLSRTHGISLVVLDDEGRELTIPSGLPPHCTKQLAREDAACQKVITASIAASRQSRKVVTASCPSGRSFFVTPVGSTGQHRGCTLFALGGRVPLLDPDLVILMEQIFRMVSPPEALMSRLTGRTVATGRGGFADRPG